MSPPTLTQDDILAALQPLDDWRAPPHYTVGQGEDRGTVAVRVPICPPWELHWTQTPEGTVLGLVELKGDLVALPDFDRPPGQGPEELETLDELMEAAEWLALWLRRGA